MTLCSLALTGLASMASNDVSDLELAVSEGDVERVQSILLQPLNKSELQSSLSTACRVGRVDILDLLVNQGAVPTSDDFIEICESCGDTRNRLQCMQLLSKHFCNLSSLDQSEVLCFAVQSKHSLIVEFLLNHGCSIAGESFHVPLISAVASNSLDCLQLLLARGADVNKIASEKKTALMSCQNVIAARCLIDSGFSKFDAVDKHGKSALHHACESKSPDLELVKLLVQDCGIDPGIKDVYGNDALEYASQCANMDVIVFLRSISPAVPPSKAAEPRSGASSNKKCSLM